MSVAQKVAEAPERRKASYKPSSLLDVFIQPTNFFSSLRIDRKIGMNAYIILVLYGIISFFLAKDLVKSNEVISLLSPELQNESTYLILYIGTSIFSVIQLLFSLLITTALYKLILHLCKIRLTFKGLFHIVLIAQVPILIGKFINLLFIDQGTVTTPITSLGFTVQNFVDSLFLTNLFNSIEVFNIWSILLIGLGVGVCVQVSTKKSISVIALTWIGFTIIASIIPALLG
ncbi:YIP1 family protein [Bacillus sp. N1-1]|uniref:YIP1 family protein n=1 Tax=Bacillus sp. N1-1 TaxID=2682541 RepID=UPI0013165C42|nr:YIP1 family protein [Bacillus sp. N1-1]QHA93600.1 hypothetical protein GNK04_20420 [Bacillus sp. N1-1]